MVNSTTTQHRKLVNSTRKVLKFNPTQHKKYKKYQKRRKRRGQVLTWAFLKKKIQHSKNEFREFAIYLKTRSLGKQWFGYQRDKILVIKDGKTRIQNKPVLFRKQTLGSYAVLTKPYCKRYSSRFWNLGACTFEIKKVVEK